MRYPYFFCTRPAAGTAFFLLAILPGISNAAEPSETSNPMSMYFDDSQMVEVATRAPKPLRQVAENVSIVTAEEIAAMNVHSVAEILKYVSGVFVLPESQDIGGQSSLQIHNSDYEHVLVLLDGMRWSFIDSEFNETNAIPVAIIDRIEVIKGAASSTWGSALGGVINIITKGTGKSIVPQGTLTATYGERNTQTYNGEVYGKVKKIGYYLHAGSLSSDGLVNDDYGRSRSFETFYGKLAADLPSNAVLTATMGRFDPYYMKISEILWGERYAINEDDFFYTLNLDGEARKNLNYHLSYQDFKREYNHPWNQRDHSLRSVMGHLNWRLDDNNVVFGTEHHRNFYEDTGSTDRIYDEFWAVYANDTIAWGKWSFTPGLRFDQNLNADDMVSPSFGITYRLTENNLVRAGVSSGFRRPPSAVLTYSTTLQPSKSWTYQAGIESTSVPFLKLKTTLFQDREKDSWSWDSAIPTVYGGAFVNTGKVRHTGFELEAETAKWQNFSVLANYTMTYTDYFDSIVDWNDHRFENDVQEVTNLVFKYDSPEITGRFSGHYTWLNTNRADATEKYDTIVWDLTLTKRLVFNQLDYDLFCTGHNIFNGAQYYDYTYRNADRWLEAGIRLHF